ncbi:MAG: type I restriction endonuclease subunit R [Mycoplasmatales bacterium]|nr:type I restriction endonuclease subunit R [Mycoplasmatales bacterium]
MKQITLNESDFEKRTLEKLQEKGYEYINSGEILKIRKNHSETLLIKHLEDSIKKINPEISNIHLNEVVGKIRRADQASLLVSNKYAHEILINGVKVFDKREKITRTYKFVDFNEIENNNFVVTNQFSMTSKNQDFKDQRPDIVVYINGLPLVVFELKSPTKNGDDIIIGAFNQIKNYQESLTSLFVFNFFNLISDLHTTKIGTITANIDRYSYWRNPNEKERSFVYQMDEVIDNLFEKQTFLNLLQNYTFFTKETNATKILAGYHQYYGVEKATESAVNAVESDKDNKKAGIFWHTQGSGKSYSMTMLAKNFINHKKKATIIVITDRSDLDEQIFQTFSKAEDFIGQEVHKINSISELKQTLKNKAQNGIYFSTVQKFDKTVGILSKREDVLIMTDEAHRSHSNIEAKYVRNEETFEVEKKFGSAALLRKAFPMATFIGFTGTPIEKEDFATKNIFGDYVTKYLMSDATKDGFVVPINYESRQAQLHLREDHIKQLDDALAEVRNEIIDESAAPAIVMKNVNKRLLKIDNLIGDPDRVKAVSKDFINHYKQRINILKGKAMFVAYNREIAMKYYEEIIKQAPELKENMRVIMTPNNQDPEQVTKLLGTKEYRRASASEFKDPNSNFKIVIVVDMWLTGFDAPSLDVIYLDKPIKMHNLMQTIARVNRVYTDKKNKQITKETGLVVDYIGIWRKLTEALAFYTNNGDSFEQKDGSWTNAEEVKEMLNEAIEKIFDICLEKMDIDFEKASNDKNYLFNIIEDMQQIVIAHKKEAQFINLVKPLSKLFKTTIAILDKEETIITQLLMIARSQIIKRELGKFDLDNKVEEIKTIMAKAIKHRQTIIYDTVENEKISLTTIINVIKNNKLGNKPELEAKKAQALAQALIKEVEKINMVKADKLSNKLSALLNKYDSNFMSVEEFMEGIKQIANEARKIDAEAHDLGITPEEMAFYQILLEDDHSKSEFDKQQIKKISLEVFQKVRKNINLSWTYNDAMKDNVRAEIYESLIIHGYPPENVKVVRENIVSQLERQIDRNPSFWEE